MNKSELKARMINHTKGGAWCPLCQQEDKQVVVIAPWISPENVLVCVYGVCSECSGTVFDAPDRLKSSLMDRIEQHLLARYPELWRKLPDGYSPTPPGGAA